MPWNHLRYGLDASKRMRAMTSLSRLCDDFKDSWLLSLLRERLQNLTHIFFPTCQVRVVRFYVRLLLLLLLLFFFLFLLLPLLLRRRAVSPLPRAAMSSVPCRTSSATICAQCSLPHLSRDHLRSVFPAGPQPLTSVLSVPCRTSTATICAQCSLPDLNRDHPRPV